MKPIQPIALCLAALLSPSTEVRSQDNILIYGNSIIQGSVTGYLSDLIVQTGAPAPNIVSFIAGNATTQTYINQIGLITSSLPAGQTWRAMTVEGGTLETTLGCGCGFNGNPTLFLANMNTLATALFAHSPQSIFIGHETGADHPSSNRYPTWFADPATWLSFPQRAYKLAAEQITAANPANPAAQIAHQGTVFANTAGYPAALYQSDDHHLSTRGKILTACLYFIEIYGGRVCDIPVDFNNPTPLVNRLLGDGLTKQAWDRLVGYADRGQPRTMRPYPGSDSDFQLQTGVNASVNLCPTKVTTAGDTLNIQLRSPLDSMTGFVAALYLQTLPTGTLPNIGPTPGLHLDPTLLTVWWIVPDLNGGVVSSTIPPGLAGNSMWLQAASRAASGSAAFPLTLSDAQVIDIQ